MCTSVPQIAVLSTRIRTVPRTRGRDWDILERKSGPAILLNEREHGLHPVPPNPEIRLDSRASRSVGSGSGLWLSSSSRTLALTRLRMVSDPRLFQLPWFLNRYGVSCLPPLTKHSIGVHGTYQQPGLTWEEWSGMCVRGVRSRLVEFPLDALFRPAWGRGRVQSTLVLGEFTISSLLNYNTLQVAGRQASGPA